MRYHFLLLPSLAFALAGCTEKPKPEAQKPPAPAISSNAVTPMVVAAAGSVEKASTEGFGSASLSTTGTAEEETAWAALLKSKRAPTPPAEWQKSPPTVEQQKEFQLSLSKKAEEIADSAKAFATRFPQSSHLKEAAKLETDMRANAKSLAGVRPSSTGTAEETTASDPLEAEGEKLFRENMKDFDPANPAPTLKKLLEVGEAFQKAHPDSPAGYRFLLTITQLPGADAAAIANKIVNSKAPEKFKEFAAAILKKTEAIGKPMDLKFTALDGRKVDISSLKGKVVMVDFWATWCGPCMAVLPEVIETYEKLHDKGMEIIGVSLDEDKDELAAFLKKKGMKWPQYFEGSWQQNKFVKEFGIEGIPSVWLVDKKGIVRNREFRGDLAAEIKKLLDEK